MDRAFLIGAGVSVDPPTEIPAAAFLSQLLVKTVEPSTDEGNYLLELTRSSRSDSRGYGDFIRFEQLLEAISESVDPNLNILGFIDRFREPNDLHRFLAREASAGQLLITTNFDCLLEESIELTGYQARTMIAGGDFKRWSDVTADLPVFKLHGSYHRYARGVRTLSSESIEGTVSRVARGISEFTLGSEKVQFLEEGLADRELWVIGYSGTDDLDIMPTLSQISMLNVIWILHHPGPIEDITVQIFHEARAKDPLVRTGFDKFLVASKAATAGLVRVIRGPTRMIMNNELAAGLPAASIVTGDGYDYISRYLNDWKRRHVSAVSLSHQIFSDLLLRTSRLKQAEKHIKKAWRDQCSSSATQVRIAAMASKVHLRRGNPIWARRWARKAVDRLVPSSSVEESVNAFHQLGYCSYKCGDLHSAEGAYRLAGSLAQANSLIAWQGVINHDRALILQDRWKITEAIQFYKNSFKLSMAVGDVQHASWTLYQLAVCNYEMARLVAAKHYLARSAALSQQIGDWNHMALIEQERGMFEFAIGRLVPAIKRFRKSGRIDQTTGVREFDGLDLFQLGVVFLEGNRHETALRLFNQSFHALQAVGDREIVAEVRAFQAQAELEVGNVAAAQSLARNARILARNAKAPSYLLRSKYLLALIKYIKGSKKQEKRLTDLIQQAFDSGMRMLALDLVTMPSSLPSVFPKYRLSPRRRKWAISVYQRWGNSYRYQLLTHR